MTSNVTTSKLVWAPGNVYVAPFGSTEPVGIAAPTSPWIPVGGTSGGVKFTFSQDWGQMDVDQVTYDHIESRLQAEGCTVETSLAELTQANLISVLNKGTSTTSTGLLTYSPGTITPGSAPTYVAVLIDSIGPGGFVRRFVGRKCLSTDNVEMESKKDDQSLWGVTFTTHWVSDSVSPWVLLDATA